jgi:Domain of unknown function (DUF4159)
MLATMKRAMAAAIALLAGTLAGSDYDDRRDPSEFVYARIKYHLVNSFRQPREVAWHHDYPYGDEQFVTVAKELTSVHTTSESYQIVDIDSKDLFKYPFAYLCEPGYMELLERDVENFREYLNRGGFVIVDDFRGRRELDNLIFQMKKVYPDRDIVPLDITHPIFHAFFDLDSLDMRPPYGPGPVEFLGLSDPNGNLQMIIDYNNDLSEVWEWLDRSEMPLQDAALSLKFGMNYLIYALAH